MKARTCGRVWTGALLLGSLALAAASPQPPKITETQKFAILNGLVSEVGIARRPLPPDKHGIEVSPSGEVLNARDVQSALLSSGDSARTGDHVAITGITFKGDRIVFTLNGGPHKEHWYSHLSVSMGSGTSPVGNTTPTGPHGAMVTLRFPGPVPPLTLQEVKTDLGSLIDFDPPAKAEEMVKPLPQAVKAAINGHRVLVGMDQDMVVAAMGRTGNKVREDNADGQPYEDWIYGAPPEATVFVRFIAGRVVRVATYRIDGTQSVDVTPDPALAVQMQQQQKQAAAAAAAAAMPAPTLRRPGDAPPPKLNPGASSPPMAPPGTNGPPDLPPAQPPGSSAPPVVCCLSPAAGA